MSVKAKRLVNPYEERMLEFLHICVDENYKIHTQVSLSQICEQVSNLDWDLRKFLSSSSAVDALITLNYNPCLVVEFQSKYHDPPEAKERDRKKATLLVRAGVPLIYSQVKDCGLLHLSSENNEVVVHNLYTGQGRENAQALIRKYCEQPVNHQLQVAAW